MATRLPAENSEESRLPKIPNALALTTLIGVAITLGGCAVSPQSAPVWHAVEAVSAAHAAIERSPNTNPRFVMVVSPEINPAKINKATNEFPRFAKIISTDKIIAQSTGDSPYTPDTMAYSSGYFVIPVPQKLDAQDISADPSFQDAEKKAQVVVLDSLSGNLRPDELSDVIQNGDKFPVIVATDQGTLMIGQLRQLKNGQALVQGSDFNGQPNSNIITISDTKVFFSPAGLTPATKSMLTKVSGN